jgi:hypothetical protein
MNTRPLSSAAVDIVARLFSGSERAAAILLLETECANNLPMLETLDAAV